MWGACMKMRFFERYRVVIFWGGSSLVRLGVMCACRLGGVLMGLCRVLSCDPGYGGACDRPVDSFGGLVIGFEMVPLKVRCVAVCLCKGCCVWASVPFVADSPRC